MKLFTNKIEELLIFLKLYDLMQNTIWLLAWRVYYLSLIFLVTVSLQAFSALSCEDFARLHHSTFVNDTTKNYRQLLTRLAQSSLRVKELNLQQIKALESYHSVVLGEKGKDGTFPRAGNYTVGQRRKIIKYLESQGFSREQVRKLIEDGVVEINRIAKLRLNIRKVLNNINEGKPVFITDSIRFIKVNKVLERTDRYGLLVEIEAIDPKTRQIVTEEMFLTEGRVIFEQYQIVNKVLEKTNRGFVVRLMNGTNAFFSFKEAIKNGLLPRNPTTKDIRELEDTLNIPVVFENSGFKSLATKRKEPKSYGKIIPDGYKFQSREDIPDLREFYKKISDSFVFTQYGYTQYSGEYRLINPEFEAIFTAARSTRKKVNSKDLQLPPPTSKVEQDYKTSYTEGLDQVNEWAYVRRRLQELGANPRTTHIEYFADQIPDFIAHIRKSLEENYFPESHLSGSKSEQLKHLESLEVEAKKAITDETVTYKWWLIFNHKLSIVMTGSHPKNKTNLGLVEEEIISEFPLKIIIPTTRGENIGIITFNRAMFEGVYPAGMINKNNINVDNTTLYPSDFFTHDIGHSILNGNRLYMDYSVSHRLLHKRLLDSMEDLPPNKRKQVEGVYFIMTHESDLNILTYGHLRLETIKSSIMNLVSNVFKLPDDPVLRKQKIEDLADTFMEVYNRAQQQL
ncbi:MAG: hypothetical protein OXM55_02510 [Bdellovibrionales bacterium]|nr:hypothetical protein [Bdellovibrionales bacterium]